MFFSQWPLKYKITSVTIIALVIGALWHGIDLLLKSNWQGLIFIGMAFIYPSWVATPEVVFLPIRKGAYINRQFIERHALFKKLTYIGLLIIFSSVLLRITDEFSLF